MKGVNNLDLTGGMGVPRIAKGRGRLGLPRQMGFPQT